MILEQGGAVLHLPFLDPVAVDSEGTPINDLAQRLDAVRVGACYVQGQGLGRVPQPADTHQSANTQDAELKCFPCIEGTFLYWYLENKKENIGVQVTSKCLNSAVTKFAHEATDVVKFVIFLSQICEEIKVEKNVDLTMDPF